MSVSTPQLTAKLPNGYGTPVGTTSGIAIPANPSRGGLLIVNNSGVTIAICPDNLAIAPTQGAYPSTNPFPTGGVAVIGGAGSVDIPSKGSLLIDNLNCGGQWNAIAAGPGGNLTFFDF